MASDISNFLNFFTKHDNIVQIKAGEHIIEKGKHDNNVRILKSGEARLELVHGKGYVDLEPGTLIGLMTVPIGRAFRHSCMALTDCEIVLIDNKQVEFMLQEYPTFAIQMIRLMAERYNNLVDLINYLCPPNKYPVSESEIIDLKSLREKS